MTLEARTTHTVQIGGLTRALPLFEVAPGVTIAVFNMLGDTLITKASAAALADQLPHDTGDVIVTAEAKSIPLAYELSALTGLPHIILRKSYKSYMGAALRAETTSITTGNPQTLYLDEKDRAFILGKRVILVDDVISTGSTLKGMEKIITEAEGNVTAILAVFTEGGDDWSNVIALGNLPVFLA